MRQIFRGRQTGDRAHAASREFPSRWQDGCQAAAQSLERRLLLSTTYNAAADFSTTANPNGVWAYGELPTVTSAFVAYPSENTMALGAPMSGWTTAATDGPPYVGENLSTTTDTTGTVSIPPNVLDMHPGPDGEYCDVRFTAPTAGAFTVTATFTGVDVKGTTTDVHVLHNGVSLADGNINGFGATFSKTLAVNVAVGDTIEFIVGYGSNDNYLDDSTSLSALITPAVPAKTIGGLDPTFGVGGLAGHDIGFSTTNGVAADGAQSVLIGAVGTAPAESFGLTRYNADGSIDTTFGNAGVATTTFAGLDAVPTAVTVLADGDILVGGTATTYANGAAAASQFAVAEYNADGSLNTAFGSGGQVLLTFAASGALTNDSLRSLVVSTGGTIYLGGQSDAAGKGNTDFAVAALTAGGASDSTFGTAGKVLVDVHGGDDAINALALQANGDVVAAGSAVVGSATDVALARFLPNGSLDRSFGNHGLVTDSVSGVADAAMSVILQPRGQIVVGGLTASGPTSSNFLVQRYTAAGRLDRTFGGTGTVVTNFGQPAGVTQLALLADGTLVASGKTTAVAGAVPPQGLDVALARYTPRGTLDTSFNGTGEVVINLDDDPGGGGGVVAAEMLAAPADSLATAFNQFTASLQGVVAVTAGGEILTAGSSGADTVEAELVAAGVDLVAKLLSALPASVLGGLKATATINITESGTQVASGTVTVTLEVAADSAGDGAVAVNKPVTERINFKQSQGRSYHLSFNYPSNLPVGGYYLVAEVIDGATLNDLNPSNNTVASNTAVNIAPPFITLAGSGLSTSATVTPGRLATITLDITNTGNVIARGPTMVDLYLSTDDTTADGTALTPERLTVNLPPNKSRVVHFRIKLPTTLAAGTFNLLAQLDPANSLGSDNDSNVLVIDPSAVTVS